MKVVAPNAHVDYGLANLIGVDSAEVSAASTVQVRTPLPAMKFGAADVAACHVCLRTLGR